MAGKEDKNMASKIDVSVIICTYNRAQMLQETLANWLKVKKEEIGIECIVVDNNSNDNTQAVVNGFIEQNPGSIKYVFEPNPGLSFARNRGIQEAGGDVIAFADDDVYFDRNWVVEIYNAFRKNGEIHCLGGNSIPFFENGQPDWLTDDLLTIYGSTKSGGNEKIMIYPEHPFGVNMAFRKTVFDAVGLFNTKLGRIKKSLLSDEEKDLFYRIDQKGLKTYYTPNAVIYHRIPEERIAVKWVVKRCYWQGISKVTFSQSSQRKTKMSLLIDALIFMKQFLVGSSPYQLKQTIFFYNHMSISTKIKKAVCLGKAKQSVVELFS